MFCRTFYHQYLTTRKVVEKGERPKYRTAWIRFAIASPSSYEMHFSPYLASRSFVPSSSRKSHFNATKASFTPIISNCSLYSPLGCRGSIPSQCRAISSHHFSCTFSNESLDSTEKQSIMTWVSAYDNVLNRSNSSCPKSHFLL
jgi:hypothetical protein